MATPFHLATTSTRKLNYRDHLISHLPWRIFLSLTSTIVQCLDCIALLQYSIRSKLCRVEWDEGYWRRVKWRAHPITSLCQRKSRQDSSNLFKVASGNSFAFVDTGRCSRVVLTKTNELSASIHWMFRCWERPIRHSNGMQRNVVH